MTACFKCGHELPPREEIFRATLCENCGADLHVCRNCGFYLPGVHWDCRETIPEAVREKDRSNFCEYFKPRRSGKNSPGSAPARDSSAGGEEKARDRFNDLFGQ